jgi:hypothetical protein
MILEDRLRDLVRAACIHQHYCYSYDHITRKETQVYRHPRPDDMQKYFDLLEEKNPLVEETRNKIKVSEIVCFSGRPSVGGPVGLEVQWAGW